MKKIRNYVSQNIFPLELGSVLLSAVLLATVYSLFETPVIMVVLFGLFEAVLCIPFVLLCHLTNARRKLGTLLCILVYGGLLFGLSYIGFMGEWTSGQSFVQWLAQDIEDTGWIMSFGIVLCIGGAMFFGTVNYYFSVVRYRMGMLVVVSIIPCVLYAKAIADVKNWYLVFIAGMNVIIAIMRRRYDRKIEVSKEDKTMGEQPTEDTEVKENKRPSVIAFSIITMTVFAAIILGICAAIPKKSDAIFYDSFEDTFLGGDINSELEYASGVLSDLSGNADGFRSDSNRRMYRVEGEVSYLKRQCFDVYNFKQDRWYALEACADYMYMSNEWNELSSGLNLSRFQYAIKDAEKLSPGFAKKYGLENVVDAEIINVPETNITITALNFEAEYYLAPPATRLIVPGENTLAFTTWAGTFINPNGLLAGDYSYRAVYVGGRSTTIEWCALGGSLENSEILGAMLDEMEAILTEGLDDLDMGDEASYDLDTVNSFKWQLEFANSYRDAVEDNNELISDEVRELAEKITAGCTYDWEKAVAIESYFHTRDFVYDLSYYAPDNSVEYFLFKSKRGTCSDYATAYVLLARAAGLTVRYCEGYAPDRAGTNDIFYVKESDGHAFPEVYIPGAGWTVFEPTSGIVDEGGAGFMWRSLLSNINIDYGLIMTIGIVVASIAVIIIIVRLIIPFVWERIFIVRLNSGKKSATDAYIRILRKVKYGRLKKKYRKLVRRDRLVKNINPYSLAPAELNERFAEVGIDASVICLTVETTAYRNPESANEKQKEIGNVYKKIISIFK